VRQDKINRRHRGASNLPHMSANACQHGAGAAAARSRIARAPQLCEAHSDFSALLAADSEGRPWAASYDLWLLLPAALPPAKALWHLLAKPLILLVSVPSGPAD